MTAWQDQRFTTDFSSQFAVRNDRTSKGDRTDEHTQEDLYFVDHYALRWMRSHVTTCLS